jgi:hypothetical protein
MPVLRVVLAGLGILMIAGAAFAVLEGAPYPVLIAPGIFGLIFIFGALYERVSYKTPLARAPGRGFVATPERFVDPSSGRLVEVHVKPATGERAYVDIGPAPTHESG